MNPQSTANRYRSAFTLVELLLSMTVLVILMLLVSQVLEHAQKAWLQARSKVSQFREARRGFDRMTSTLSQATLNSYVAYRFDNSVDPLVPQRDIQRPGRYLPPQSYIRYSELEFLSGPSATYLATDAVVSPGHCVFFQAPLGVSDQGEVPVRRMPTALNPVGYFVSFGSDAPYRPPFLAQLELPERYRYRLIEFRPPAQSNLIYDRESRDVGADWFAEASNLASPWRRPIADNVLALIISPKRSVPPGASSSGSDPRDVAAAYTYDSKPPAGQAARLPQMPQDYELPPLVEITMFVIDEVSADRLQLDNGQTPPLAMPQGLFQQANSNTHAADVKAFEDYLVSSKINYRSFTATVGLRASKWGL